MRFQDKDDGTDDDYLLPSPQIKKEQEIRKAHPTPFLPSGFVEGLVLFFHTPSIYSP